MRTRKCLELLACTGWPEKAYISDHFHKLGQLHAHGCQKSVSFVLGLLVCEQSKQFLVAVISTHCWACLKCVCGSRGSQVLKKFSREETPTRLAVVLSIHGWPGTGHGWPKVFFQEKAW